MSAQHTHAPTRAQQPNCDGCVERERIAHELRLAFLRGFREHNYPPMPWEAMSEPVREPFYAMADWVMAREAQP